MAAAPYPTSCLSAYCGRVLCDSCQYRPLLKRYHEARGEGEKYEAEQEELRADKAAGRGIFQESSTC